MAKESTEKGVDLAAALEAARADLAAETAKSADLAAALSHANADLALVVADANDLNARLNGALEEVAQLKALMPGNARQNARLSALGRAKIVNALRSLPAGYAFHSDEPALRCITWAEGFPAELHNAACEVIASIGQYHPDMIGGSGWIAEGNRRMRLVAGVEVVAGGGALGMSPGDLAAALIADKAKAKDDLAARAEADRAAEAKAKGEEVAGIAAAFAPGAGAAPAGGSPADVGGSGSVAVEEEDDMSGEE